MIKIDDISCDYELAINAMFQGADNQNSNSYGVLVETESNSIYIGLKIDVLFVKSKKGSFFINIPEGLQIAKDILSGNEPSDASISFSMNNHKFSVDIKEMAISIYENVSTQQEYLDLTKSFFHSQGQDYSVCKLESEDIGDSYIGTNTRNFLCHDDNLTEISSTDFTKYISVNWNGDVSVEPFITYSKPLYRKELNNYVLSFLPATYTNIHHSYTTKEGLNGEREIIFEDSEILDNVYKFGYIFLDTIVINNGFAKKVITDTAMDVRTLPRYINRVKERNYDLISDIRAISESTMEDGDYETPDIFEVTKSLKTTDGETPLVTIETLNGPTIENDIKNMFIFNKYERVNSLISEEEVAKSSFIIVLKENSNTEFERYVSDSLLINHAYEEPLLSKIIFAKATDASTNANLVFDIGQIQIELDMLTNTITVDGVSSENGDEVAIIMFESLYDYKLGNGIGFRSACLNIRCYIYDKLEQELKESGVLEKLQKAESKLKESIDNKPINIEQ